MKTHVAIIGVLALIIVAVIALNISFDRSLQMEMAEQFNKQQLLLARAEASNIQRYIGKVKDEMLRIAEIASMFHVDEEIFLTFLSDGFLKDMDRIRMGITLTDGKGRVLLTRGDLADEELYRKNIAEIAKTLCPKEVLIRQDIKRVSLTAPVCSSGSLTNALHVSLDIQDLAREFLGPIKSGARGYAWMMDDSGDLLYHPTQPDMVGRNLYRTDTSCFKCHESFDVEKKIIEGKGDYYGKYVAPSGEDKVLAFSTASVGDAKWIVAVSAPYTEVTMSIQRSMKFHSWFLFLVFMTTSIVFAMLVVMNRKRVKAEEMAKHRKELERYAGELKKEVDIRTRELTTEKEKLNTVVSTIGSGIILIDNQRRIQWINERMKDIVGKDITGMLCDDFFSDCTLIGSYKVNDMQTDILSSLFGQEDKYFQVTTAPVRGTGEGINGYIRLIHDVTEMKRMEEQMMHSEKLALLERLTKDIASPLSSILSLVQKKESLETINLYMNRIADILKQLSGFSQTPSVELKPCRVNNLIEDSLSLIQYDARVNNITIVRDLSPGMPEITTDRNLLSQVVVNLVLNAADAMPGGGTLTIRSRHKDAHIVITFEDTGYRMPGENLSRIFDPFYTQEESGQGLGLAVSHSIIEKLNGSLTVTRDVNEVSKIVIILPLD
jgi:signal transduction histidine kinase